MFRDVRVEGVTVETDHSIPTRFLRNVKRVVRRTNQCVAAGDGRTFETLDPATAQPITTVAQAGAEDIDRAVGAARRALDGGPWAQVSR